MEQWFEPLEPIIHGHEGGDDLARADAPPPPLLGPDFRPIVLGKPAGVDRIVNDPHPLRRDP